MRKTALQFGRSVTVVSNYLKDKKGYGTKKSPGRTPKITYRDKRTIFNLATRNKMCSRQIRDHLELPVKARRVRQVLHENVNAAWVERKGKPSLKAHHRERRLVFAKAHIDWGEKWKTVLFSDEKKFNLDGPDCVQYYWHDLRHEKEIKMSRNFGGGSVMVWGGFAFAGQLPIAWISSKMNSLNYIDLLDVSLVNDAEQLLGPDFIFQQDNASIHTSKATMDFFKERQIPVLDWPACSPDLNPIENLWGWLVRRVYINGTQYNSVNELRTAIRVAWGEIPRNYMETLVLSMKNRLIAVLENKGGSTKY